MTEQPNPFIEHLKAEIDITGFQCHPDNLAKVFALLDCFQAAGHSGFSSSIGIANTVNALRDCAYAILNKSLGCTTWSQVHAILTAMDKPLEELESGPEKWLREEVLACMEAMGEIVDVEAKEIDWILHLYRVGAEFGLLRPLTGKEDEWIDHGPYLRNKRYGSVFWDKGDDQAYQNDKHIFSDNLGLNWFTGPYSAEYISFPYRPTHTYTLVSGDNRTPIIAPITSLNVGDKLMHVENGVFVITVIEDGEVTLKREINEAVISIEELCNQPIQSIIYSYPSHSKDDNGVTTVGQRKLVFTEWFKPESHTALNGYFKRFIKIESLNPNIRSRTISS